MKDFLNRKLQNLRRMSGILDNRSIEVLSDEEVIKSIKYGKKTLLYIGIRYDYGYRHWGLSYEHYNLYDTLSNMDFSMIYFDYDRLKQKFGSQIISQILLELVNTNHPDFLFYVHYLDWINHDVWKEISRKTPTKTIIWLCDDHWRFEETRPLWELFDLIVTTDPKGFEKRKSEGYNNVFLSQWGFNHFLYKKLNVPKIYDVSFVGRCYGERRNFIDTLKKKGIKIATFGPGWGNEGRISQGDLIKIYNQSKISLNISSASKDNVVLQIKGRDFEAPGCGSALLTKHTEYTSRFFIPGKEIITYNNVEDAADKILYYLEHAKELNDIAKNGYERALREHTFEKRLLDIFNFAQNIK